MADMLQQGLAWLKTMRTNYMASPVTYRRGQEQTTVNATLGKTDYESSDENGFTIKAYTNDFLIAADELVLAGKNILPHVGDQIMVTRGSVISIFEVLALPNEGCYRWSDPYSNTLRVHAKQIQVQ